MNRCGVQRPESSRIRSQLDKIPTSDAVVGRWFARGDRSSREQPLDAQGDVVVHVDDVAMLVKQVNPDPTTPNQLFKPFGVARFERLVVRR